MRFPRFPARRKPFQSRRVVALVVVGAMTLLVGFAAASQITVDAINQVAYATAQCGSIQTNLDFAVEARVALFTREKMTPAIVLSALIAGILAAFFAPGRDEEPLEPRYSESDLKRLQKAMSANGFDLEDVIHILTTK